MKKQKGKINQNRVLKTFEALKEIREHCLRKLEIYPQDIFAKHQCSRAIMMQAIEMGLFKKISPTKYISLREITIEDSHKILQMANDRCNNNARRQRTREIMAQFPTMEDKADFVYQMMSSGMGKNEIIRELSIQASRLQNGGIIENNVKEVSKEEPLFIAADVYDILTNDELIDQFERILRAANLKGIKLLKYFSLEDIIDELRRRGVVGNLTNTIIL